MKKEYMKPMIVFENFRVSSSIAANCTYEANSTEGACGLDLGGYVVFISEANGCRDMQSANGEWNSVCYHGPNPESNVFGS